MGGRGVGPCGLGAWSKGGGYFGSLSVGCGKGGMKVGKRLKEGAVGAQGCAHLRVKDCK